MKYCIWCEKKEYETTFKKLAHTIPQTLGGKDICQNVCDNCNEYFGMYSQGFPSIETVIKETFNITRARLLSTQGEIGRNKPLAKFSSIYFKVDWINRKVSLKPSYQYKNGFQKRIGSQIKKGLYKIFLEELERQKGEGHDTRYNFIREFCRNGVGDLPVMYFERRLGVILIPEGFAANPKFYLEEEQQFTYLVQDPSFFEFEFLGHVFGIATSENWQLTFPNYLNKTIEAKREFFKELKFVENFNDIDLTLNIIDKKS